MIQVRKHLVGAGLCAALAGGFLAALPVVQPTGPRSAMLTDREGLLLAARVADDGQWRLPPMESLPDRYIQCVLAFEDRRFFQHPGVDPLAVLRAVAQNLRAGRVVSGASTLTMQVVRLSRDSPPRTWSEKIYEAMLALRLDWARSKSDILSMYAHHAPFGGNVVGLPAAAFRYFGRRPEQMTWAEAALLAVLPNSPGLLHPGRGRHALKKKRNRLLARLHQNGVLSSVDRDLAFAEPLPGPPRPMPQSGLHLLSRRQETAPWRPTTLVHRLQMEAERILRRGVGRSIGVHNGGAVILEVTTGSVLAYVGNSAPLSQVEHHPYVDVVRAPRSTGSILKPFLYALALDAGEVNPAHRLVDAPLRLGTFRPENFDGGHSGLVRADLALARSLNVPAVLLLRDVGVSRFLAFLQRSGLTTLERSAQDYGLSLVLGGAEANLWELTALYSSLSFRAQRAGPLPVAAAEPTFGVPATRAEVSQGAAYLTLTALRQVTRPEERRWSGGRSMYWKTGTSYGFRDAWAIGVTKDHAVGVWVGNADGEGRPGLTGLTAAAPILFDLFDLLPDPEPIARPGPALEPLSICAHSGHRPGPDCAQTTRTWMPVGHRYGHTCPFCQSVSTTEDGSQRVHVGCHPWTRIRSTPRFVVPAHIARHAGSPSAASPLPPWAPGCEPSESRGEEMSCVFPPENGSFFVPRELSSEKSRLVLEAAHLDPEAVIHWHLDDQYLASTDHIHQVEVAPPPGWHRLTLVDHRGARVERRFHIISDPKEAYAPMNEPRSQNGSP